MTSETQALHIAIREALSALEEGNVTILSALLTVEDTIGYIPPEAIEVIAERTRSAVNDVWGVASFYTNFRFTPPGKHIIEVCWGPSCHFLGAKDVIKEVMEFLGMTSEGDLTGNEITFKYNTCLGACSQAPVINVDRNLIGRVLPNEVRKRIAEVLARLTDKT